MRHTIVVCACVLALALVPATASAQSAFPLKAQGDSGVVPQNELGPSDSVSLPGDSNAWVRGFDACTYLQLPGDTQSNYQQYNVGNCVPIQTPWIKIDAWHTQGWATYCPGSAPNSWIDSDGGGLQQITGREDVENMNEVENDNSDGPSPPAKNDYYTTNWAVHSSYWMYLVGCSPQIFQNDGDGGNYCCGQGTSAIPNFSSSTASTSAKTRKARLVKGPRRERRRGNAGYYSETRERDLSRSKRRTYRATCAKGYRVTFARHGIGYYTGHMPGKKDGNVKDSRKRVGNRGFKVAVRTDKRIKRGKVRIQLHIGCAKPGWSYRGKGK